MKEIIDIVDKNDRVIGKAEREVCHKKGLKHRIAAVWVFNDKGEILVQKRSSKAETHPDKLDHSAAGHVKSGTTCLDAAKCELKEELGIRCKLKKTAKFENKSIDRGKISNHLFTLFFCIKNKGFKIDRNEVGDIKFYKVSEIDKKIKKHPNQFCSSFVKVFKLLKKEGKI